MNTVERCRAEIQEVLARDPVEIAAHPDLHRMGITDWTVEELLVMEEEKNHNGEYQRFLESKRAIIGNAGLGVDPSLIHPSLFPFQRAITAWAGRKGRAAVFADTGLGKTRIQIEWARLIGGRSLIVAPLTVGRQTVGEAAKIGIAIHQTRDSTDLRDGINITNYEVIERFDPGAFHAVVLDESSILKALSGKTRQRLTDMFSSCQYRLCCTATPAPNDISEIGNHAEFLGIMRRTEMLAQFFVHDDQGWRLKKFAREPFYRWLASWGMSVRTPSDIGFDDAGYDLPPLRVEPLWIHTEWKPDGCLFPANLEGIRGRLQARRASVAERVQAAAQIITASSDQWIIWCGLNDEAKGIATAVGYDARLVEGSQSPEEKSAAMEAFQDGSVRVLITKARISGFGMNFQNCHNMIFLGFGDSYEQYYQCIRRSYRFGQTHPVNAWIILSEAERVVYDNVMRKEREARTMTDNLIRHVADYEKHELDQETIAMQYEEEITVGRNYRMLLGDSVERLNEVASDSVGLSVFSPPFLSLYVYSPTERDLGNSRTEEEFWEHFGYVIDGLLRVSALGRNCCVHVAQVPAMLVRDGYIGMRDFRGRTIQEFEKRRWIYHGEVCVDKDPQVQAIRTHSKGLSFGQMRKDSSWLRPCLADYILIFRKPGENTKPILTDITNDQWISWARAVWYGINETETLNTREARDHDDERHICALQLGVIERCIRLWSNPGDLILDPFAGIGSTGYVALQNGRKFTGIELKQSYFATACKNLEQAGCSGQQNLFERVAQ